MKVKLDTMSLISAAIAVAIWVLVIWTAIAAIVAHNLVSSTQDASAHRGGATRLAHRRAAVAEQESRPAAHSLVRSRSSRPNRASSPGTIQAKAGPAGPHAAVDTITAAAKLQPM